MATVAPFRCASNAELQKQASDEGDGRPSRGVDSPDNPVAALADKLEAAVALANLEFVSVDLWSV